ncbi:MAG TPA: hypothetical protein VFI25_03220 [Planctomycetota bacterium]|jgi:hypothetical protein|nr:hypothetical protein [Planctomycetota bacterium]
MRSDGPSLARSPLAPLCLAVACVTVFSTGVLPAVRDARALAERRETLHAENARLEERVRLLRAERSTLPSDLFLNERMRRREFHAGPEPDGR